MNEFTNKEKDEFIDLLVESVEGGAESEGIFFLNKEKGDKLQMLIEKWKIQQKGSNIKLGELNLNTGELKIDE